MLDLVIVPIRWMLAQDIVNSYARRLALCETFSQAFQVMESDPSLSSRLSQIGGVAVDNINLRMRVARVQHKGHEEESIVAIGPGHIPPAWLPDGAKGPCSYSLEVDVNAQMSPAILLPAAKNKIVGLNAPIPLLVSASHQWENLGRNPVSKDFFVNE